MSGTVMSILIYHRHQPMDLINIICYMQVHTLTTVP
jgi:hypothetical protein